MKVVSSLNRVIAERRIERTIATYLRKESDSYNIERFSKSNEQSSIFIIE